MLVHVYFFQLTWSSCADRLSDQRYRLYSSIFLNKVLMHQFHEKLPFQGSSLRLCALFIGNCNLLHAKIWGLSYRKQAVLGLWLPFCSAFSLTGPCQRWPKHRLDKTVHQFTLNDPTFFSDSPVWSFFFFFFNLGTTKQAESAWIGNSDAFQLNRGVTLLWHENKAEQALKQR